MEAMDELRGINPNPSLSEYEQERRIVVRKFCMTAAIEAVKSGQIQFTGKITDLAEDLYNWIMGTVTDPETTNKK